MSVFLRIRVTFLKGTNRKAESAYQASRQSREMRLTWNSREFFLLLLQECHTLIIEGTRWAISCACTCADLVNGNTNQNQFQFEMLHSFNNFSMFVRMHFSSVQNEWHSNRTNEKEKLDGNPIWFKMNDHDHCFTFYFSVATLAIHLEWISLLLL